MENVHEGVRKLCLSGNQNLMVFKEKLKFSGKDLLQFSVDDALYFALPWFGRLLDTQHQALQQERGGHNTRKVENSHVDSSQYESTGPLLCSLYLTVCPGYAGALVLKPVMEMG